MALTKNMRLQTIEPTDYFCPDKLSDNFEALDALGVDYVVEQGSRDIWRWRKWKSGIAELWGFKTFGATTDTGMLQAGVTYPFTFAKEPVPMVTCGVDGQSDSYTAYVNTHGDTAALDCYVNKTGDASKEFYVEYSIKGRWK